MIGHLATEYNQNPEFYSGRNLNKISFSTWNTEWQSNLWKSFDNDINNYASCGRGSWAEDFYYIVDLKFPMYVDSISFDLQYNNTNNSSSPIWIKYRDKNGILVLQQTLTGYTGQRQKVVLDFKTYVTQIQIGAHDIDNYSSSLYIYDIIINNNIEEPNTELHQFIGIDLSADDLVEL